MRGDGAPTACARALAAGWRELALYLAAGVVYVAIGVNVPEFLFSWVVAAGYLLLCVVALPGSRAACSAREPEPQGRLMSWAAHDLEPYVIQKHMGKKVAFVPLLIGSYAPDVTSKWFVYGVGAFGVELKADNPAQFHRGWPGVGFTHSLTFGVVIGLILFAIFRNHVVAYSFVIGQWAHALTDTGDTVGTMLLFPFTDHLFSVGAWAYAGQTGRYIDAGAYFSGLGFVWDGVFVVWGILSWRVLTRGLLPGDDRGRRPVLALGRALPLGDDPRHALPDVVLLRDRPLDGVAHLGTRRAQLRVRPALGRARLGASRVQRD